MSQRPKRHKSGKMQAQPTADVPPVVEVPHMPQVAATGGSKIPWIIVFLFGFLLYANTIPFKHALDDKLAITENEFTKKGFAGIGDLLSNDMLTGFFGKKKKLVEGGRYRPLSMITFAIEWQLFGPGKGSNEAAQIKATERMASVSHTVNALLYGLTGLLLYLVLLNLAPPGEGKQWFMTFPFIATLIYLAHPLHTEVVANIKSRDELFAVIGGLGALLFVYRALTAQDSGKMIVSIAIANALFFLSCFSKESGLTFLGVIPLTMLFFQRADLKKNIIVYAPLLLTAAIYWSLRSIALGDVATADVAPELMNKPFMHTDPDSTQWLATVLLTWGIYLKLLVFPHPLTHDYYPWHPLTDDPNYAWENGFPYAEMGDTAVMIPIVIYSLMALIGVVGLVMTIVKKTPWVLAYCCLLYLGTFILFSNLIFDIGAFMNERFLYVPSLGFAILMGWLLADKLPQWLKGAGTAIGLGLAAIMVVAFSYKTYDRNFAWEDDFSLSSTDVVTSPNSAKVRMSYGGALIDKAKEATNEQEKINYLNESIQNLARSLELYPGYVQPMLLLGNAYYEAEDWENSIKYFGHCFDINPTYPHALQNMEHMGDLMRQKKNYQLSVQAYEALVKTLDRGIAIAGQEMAKGKDVAVNQQLIRQHRDKQVRILEKQGEMYGKDMQDLANSIATLERAFAIAPKNSGVLQKIGVATAMTGQHAKALEYFEACIELDPDNAYVMMNLGMTHGNMGNEALAQEWLDKSCKLEPKLCNR